MLYQPRPIHQPHARRQRDALARMQRRVLDRFPLFADQLADRLAAEETLSSRPADRGAGETKARRRAAAEWREARREFYSLTPAQRADVRRMFERSGAPRSALMYRHYAGKARTGELTDMLACYARAVRVGQEWKDRVDAAGRMARAA